MSNKKKSEQLGMSYGKASAKLRKSLLFFLAQKCESDNCYRCSNKIEKIEDLSIEHKIPWLDSEDPVELFFNLDNISFSHLKCNVASRRIDTEKCKNFGEQNGKSKIGPLGFSWCGFCKTFLPKVQFTINKRTRSKTEWICRSCRKTNRTRKIQVNV